MNKKSLIALSLVAMMAFGVACSNGADSDVETGSETQTESPAN